MNKITLEKYHQWEPYIDGSFYLTAGTLTSLSQGAAVGSPAMLGSMLFSGTYAFTMIAARELLNYFGIQSKFLRISLLTLIIALNLFANPLLIGNLAAHTVVVLTREMALDLTLALLLSKVASYVIFKTGNFLSYLGHKPIEITYQRTEVKSTLLKKGILVAGACAGVAIINHFVPLTLRNTAMIGGLIAAPFVLAGSYRALAHAFSPFSFKETIEALAKKRYEAVRAATLSCSSGQNEDLEGTPDEKSAFYKGIESIRLSLKSETPPDGDVHEYMQDVRSKVDDVLSSPIYLSNKTKNEGSTLFLQAVAHAFNCASEGMPIIEKYGKKVAQSKPVSYEEMSQILKESVEASSHFHRDSLIGKVFWAFAHPEKLIPTAFDALGLDDPLSYNSYKHGNANTKVGVFKIGGANFHFSLGPTPTCDRLFEAHLLHLRRRGSLHFQQDLESTSLGAEKKRVAEKGKLAASYEEEFVHLVTPFDGDIPNGRAEFKGIDKAADFFGKLGVYLNNPCRENAFILPKIVENTDVEGLLETANVAFTALQETPHWKLIQKDKRLNKAMLLGFEGMLSIQALSAIARERGGILGALDCFMGQACKQDIDRGVVANVTTILFADALSGVELTEERFHQIVGIVLVRAGMVDNRAIMEERFIALYDLFKLIGTHSDAFFDPFRAHFRKQFNLTKFKFETHS